MLFLSVASGSLAELGTQLLLSIDLGYGNPLELAVVESEGAEIREMVSAIQRKVALRREKKRENAAQGAATEERGRVKPRGRAAMLDGSPESKARFVM